MHANTSPCVHARRSNASVPKFKVLGYFQTTAHAVLMQFSLADLALGSAGQQVSQHGTQFAPLCLTSGHNSKHNITCGISGCILGLLIEKLKMSAHHVREGIGGPWHPHVCYACALMGARYHNRGVIGSQSESRAQKEHGKAADA
jgi:hypothetical protein